MATTKKPVQQTTEPKEEAKVDVSAMMELIKSLTEQVNELKKEKSDHENIRTEYFGVAKMDRPCTLIHLYECHPMLPSTIKVNGNEIRFTKFGERRTFRFAEMQDITQRYRDWFDRGIFTLGEDCNDFVNDFGLDIMNIPMQVEQHNKLATLPIDEFKSIIDNIQDVQALLIAKTWVDRYNAGNTEYNNLNKIRILNKKTKGFMKQFMSDMLNDDVE